MTDQLSFDQAPTVSDPEPNYDAEFAGEPYERSIDHARLTGQLKRIYDLMRDGQWRTIDEIAGLTGDPGLSILAQLGHLRKQRFGAYLVEKQSRGERLHGLYEYRVGGKGEGVPQRHPLAVVNEQLRALLVEAEARLQMQVCARCGGRLNV